MVVKTKRRAEPPVVDELHDGIQFVEPVFERRARQHQREPRTKPLDHAAGLRYPVLDALAFVENDEVPIHPFDREDVTQHLFVVAYGKEAVVGVLGASRGDAADDQLAIAVTEAPDFVPPLRFHRSGTDDEHLQYASLRLEQPHPPDGWDGSAKPHVIGKYRAAGAGGERDAVELIRQ